MFRVGLDLGVRYADDLEAQFLQEELSFAVVDLLFWVVVDCAVDFEDESEFRAKEVGDVRADWVLAAEFEAVERSVAQVLPDERLGGCHRATKAAGGRDVVAVEFLAFVHKRIVLRNGPRWPTFRMA